MLKKSFKKSILLILVFTLTLGLVACGKTGEDVVAIVDGDEISLDVFYKNYEMIKSMYEMQLGEGILDEPVDKDEKGQDITLKEKLVDEIIQQLVVEKLILHDADKRDIKIDDKEIDAKVASYIEMMGGQENFDNYLETNKVTVEDFKEDVKKMEIASKHKEAVMNEIKISEKDAKKYFEENKEGLEKVHARHILVETEAEANEVIGKIKAGESFEELAKEKSKDVASAVNGGDLDFFVRGDMNKDFEDVAFALGVGEVSEAIKTDYGYHIIKVEGKKDSFEALKPDVEFIIKEEKYTEALQDLEKKAKVEIFKDKIKFEEKKTEEKKDEKEATDKE